ncbi:MAG TPA: PKD domain-containing protein [Kofleriaceae bacterium]|nr:PKD domain-containing protein [Kofleriaceae bacterium]
MRVNRILMISIASLAACDPAERLDGESQAAIVAAAADPSPTISFTQVGRSVGINRASEPPSAGTFTSAGTLAYGSWLADLDGDGLLDYYAVNHGQTPHLSGLFINNASGGFGNNLFTVGVQAAPQNPAYLGLSNEMRFVGDLNGDGRIDLFFLCWSGFGVLCINQGVAAHSDWTGPGYQCFNTSDGVAFSDVNGDGKIDVLALADISNFDVYAAYYAQTAPYVWRLNNGDPNINHWPTTQNFLALRVTDPLAVAAPFVDLNNDGIPDKIVGIAQPPGSRGTYGTAVAGQQVFLGQASGSYVLKSGSGLEAVTEPITRIEDVNDDGCLDIGTDRTGYRDNQNWYVQNKSGASCTATFTATARTALPYYPGFKRYSVDVDNSGLVSKVSIIHVGYGNNNGRPGGATIYRKQASGTYVAITPAQSGINLNGSGTSEFYADNLSPGDWNDDGKLDFAGSGSSTIANTDSGFALWTSNLGTTNSWIKITLPSVTGFFAGAATIELFDSGFSGDASHLVSPPRVLYPGKAWASQVYHFGIGTRSAVDVRVTFPDGRQVARAGVAPASRISIEPTSNAPPVAVATAQPTTAAIGQTVTFDGSRSSDPDGSIAGFAWDFGDGGRATTATATHAYQAAGTFIARLTVTDNAGSTASATLPITIADSTPPTIAITSGVFTPALSDNIGVVKVEWYFDGALSATATAAPFGYTLNLTPVAGAHTLVARAFDAAGNTTDSAPVTIQQ